MSKENITSIHHEKVKTKLIDNKQELYNLKVKNIYMYHILNYFVDNTTINIIVESNITMEELKNIEKFIEILFPSFYAQNFLIISNESDIISFVLGTLIF